MHTLKHKHTHTHMHTAGKLYFIQYSRSRVVCATHIYAYMIGCMFGGCAGGLCVYANVTLLSAVDILKRIFRIFRSQSYMFERTATRRAWYVIQSRIDLSLCGQTMLFFSLSFSLTWKIALSFKFDVYFQFALSDVCINVECAWRCGCMLYQQRAIRILARQQILNCGFIWVGQVSCNQIPYRN